MIHTTRKQAPEYESIDPYTSMYVPIMTTPRKFRCSITEPAALRQVSLAAAADLALIPDYNAEW